MPIYDLPNNLMTDEVFRSGFRGVFYGGCIERKEGSSFRRKAHCHNSKSDKYYGWICYRSAKRLNQRGLMIHELAHLVCGARGHCRKFYETIRRLGGAITKSDRYLAPVATKGL